MDEQRCALANVIIKNIYIKVLYYHLERLSRLRNSKKFVLFFFLKIHKNYCVIVRRCWSGSQVGTVLRRKNWVRVFSVPSEALNWTVVAARCDNHLFRHHLCVLWLLGLSACRYNVGGSGRAYKRLAVSCRLLGHRNRRVLFLFFFFLPYQENTAAPAKWFILVIFLTDNGSWVLFSKFYTLRIYICFVDYFSTFFFFFTWEYTQVFARKDGRGRLRAFGRGCLPSRRVHRQFGDQIKTKDR